MQSKLTTIVAGTALLFLSATMALATPQGDSKRDQQQRDQQQRDQQQQREQQQREQQQRGGRGGAARGPMENEGRVRQMLEGRVRNVLKLPDSSATRLISTTFRYRDSSIMWLDRERFLRRELRFEQDMYRENPANADNGRITCLMDNFMIVQQRLLDLRQAEDREIKNFLPPIKRLQYFGMQENLHEAIDSVMSDFNRRREGGRGEGVGPPRGGGGGRVNGPPPGARAGGGRAALVSLCGPPKAGRG
jgi:hypothetical protein